MSKKLWGKDKWDSELFDGCNTGSGKGFTGYKCYTTHKPLKLPGTDFVIYGGSCGSPVVTDADVYIGFDKHSMSFTDRHWPWKEGEEILFPVTDMSVPSSVGDYKKLVSWTLEKLQEGKKVHCGCIGGHGRTGMFLAALVCECGEADAITYVRENYCHKAVESKSQVDFLVKHFGSKPASATKGFVSSTKGYSPKSYKPVAAPKKFIPLPSNGHIWGN